MKGRRRSTFFYLPLLIWAVAALTVCFWLAEVASRALQPPPPPDQDLQHLRRNRSLKHYLDNIQLLIEPSSTSCGTEEVMVIILVTSAPQRYEAREAIRQSWGQHLPTYFVMGLQEQDADDQLVNNYVEAKQYSDLIVFDFHDHYQNLTLKTALMIKWTLERCPRAQFLFKADDDVLVNPWTLKDVLKENRHAKLLGYRRDNTSPHRDEYTKWYLPRWLFPEDLIGEYLTGPGYIVNGECLEMILKAAFGIPLVNIEDVYFTYLVGKRALGLALTHERRLSPHKPWTGLSCAYWDLASAHSLSPPQMASAWRKIQAKSNTAKNTSEICTFYKKYIASDLFLY